jgi:predicted TIM-barrel fold metal-dependent hydrolase
MMGLRLNINQHKASVAEGKTDWLWPEAERTRTPLMLSVTTDLFPEVAKIAAKYPGLRLAIDHLAMVRGKKDAAASVNLPHVLALAKWPNVSAKCSALPSYSSESYPYLGLHETIRRVYDAFGPERMFWGTDLTRLPCTYRQAITLFTEELPWLTTADLEWIMGRSLCGWLGWAMPAKV